MDVKALISHAQGATHVKRVKEEEEIRFFFRKSNQKPNESDITSEKIPSRENVKIPTNEIEKRLALQYNSKQSFPQLLYAR